MWDTAAPTRTLGGSAGIFALLGVDFCLTVEALLKLLNGWEHGWDGEEALGKMAWLGINILQTVLRVHGEQQSLAAGKSLQVSNAGHLTGFLWGLGVFAVFRWWRSVGRLRVRQGTGRGHRLGGSGHRRLGGR